MLLLGAVGVLGFQAVFIGGLLSLDDIDPLILNPDSDLNRNGISMVMLCSKENLTSEGIGSELLSSMPPNGDSGAWTRGRTVRGGCDIFYHHDRTYNPHAWETCTIGCDHDVFERRLFRRYP